MKSPSDTPAGVRETTDGRLVGSAQRAGAHAKDVLVAQPVRLHPRRDAASYKALERDLVAAIEGEVRFDAGSRALYATDASNYRQVPIGVVIPRTVDDVATTVALCHRHGAPVLSRGGGTSLCGQTCNVAVVIDFSKYLNRI